MSAVINIAPNWLGGWDVRVRSGGKVRSLRDYLQLRRSGLPQDTTVQIQGNFGPEDDLVGIVEDTLQSKIGTRWQNFGAFATGVLTYAAVSSLFDLWTGVLAGIATGAMAQNYFDSRSRDYSRMNLAVPKQNIMPTPVYS